MAEGDNFIRISYDDANSEHVESLLRRQMSLRGERGITNVRPRRWFYQSWFILMLAAGLFAFSAWALIEPFFDDMIYLQGPIKNVNYTQPLDTNYTEDGQQMHLKIGGRGWIEVAGQKVWLIDQTKLWQNGKAKPFTAKDLKVGQEVGAYVEPVPKGNEPLILAAFVDPSPKPQAQSDRTMSQLMAQHTAASLLLFPLVAGLIGLAVGAVDGIVCRLPRRAIVSG